MRVRYFSIILTILLVVAGASIGLNALYVSQERFKRIDQQIRDTASSLIDSELGDIRAVNFKRIDAIISEELGESRIGKFFVIRNEAGQILFASAGTKTKPLLDIPQSPQWITLELKGGIVRVLNLQLPRIPDRTLQVGAVFDEDVLAPPYFSKGSLLFLALILSLGFAAAWVLTQTLLRPISQLSEFVTDAAVKTTVSQELPEPPGLLNQANTFFGRHFPDEFSRLLSGLSELIRKINRNHKLARLWTYQMAHELKTPLSIMAVEIEAAQAKGEISAELAEALCSEVHRASGAVSSFLDWAELENSRPKNLHAMRLAKAAQSVCARLDHKYPGRVKVEAPSDLEVVAAPAHLEQALQNLVTNALKYSPEHSPVEVRLEPPRLTVRDHGLGLPESVRLRLGEPFNRGSGESGSSSHGLGLAWVSSVAKLYGWKFEVRSDEHGTEASIHFPVTQ